jgi:Tfp pilus assembly PilM family ATPase
MAGSFPQEVFVLDGDGLLLARLQGNGRGARVVGATQYRFGEPPFADAPVTPSVTRPEALTEAVRRAKRDAGRLDRASLLLPDSWFRMNLLELPTGGDRSTSIEELIRWSVKRTLPVRAEEMRFAWTPLLKSSTGNQGLAVGAMQASLKAVERAFADAGVALILIEPIGLNVWNAAAARASDNGALRLFFHLTGTEFTTGLFQGGIPLFLRSRNLTDTRDVRQEIALSASYLRSRLDWNTPAESWVSGNRVAEPVLETIAAEFAAPVRRLRLEDVSPAAPEEASKWEAELLGCVGVFTA